MASTRILFILRAQPQTHMKSAALVTCCLLLTLAQPVFSQSVIISPEIILPKDSITKNQLINSLNGFIALKDKSASENKYIFKDDLLTTKLLLVELKGIEKNITLKDDNFYSPYLANVVSVDSNNYRLQLSYMGIKGNAPVLKMAFRLMARRVDGVFYFYSPLKYATQHWKAKKLGNITFHFKDTLNVDGAKFFEKTVHYYDTKLKVAQIATDDYYCDDLTEAMQIAGIDYKLNYNGIKYDNLEVSENNTQLIVNGWNSPGHRFDTHDLWHERLGLVVKAETINRPVDEGCAYLYGGSWLVYSWPDIIAAFKKYAAENPNSDWLSLYIDEKNKNFLNGQKPLKISYAINALIVQKVEKEKGFAPITALLTCGKVEKGDENYFKALEKVSGITKANFNSEVWKLVKDAH